MEAENLLEEIEAFQKTVSGNFLTEEDLVTAEFIKLNLVYKLLESGSFTFEKCMKIIDTDSSKVLFESSNAISRNVLALMEEDNSKNDQSAKILS